MVDKKKRNVDKFLEAAMLICGQKIARYSHVIKIDQSLIRKARNQSTSFKPSFVDSDRPKTARQ